MRLLASLALSLAACPGTPGATLAPEPSPPPPRVVSPDPRPPTPAPAAVLAGPLDGDYLTWSWRDAKVWTTWTRVTSGAAAEQRTHEGLLAAGGEHLWLLAETSRAFVRSCGDDDSSRPKGEVSDFTLVDVLGSRRVPLATGGPPADSPVCGFDRHLRPIAVIGPTFLLELCGGESYDESSHGEYACESRAVDLRTGRFTSVVSAAELERLAAANADLARANLQSLRACERESTSDGGGEEPWGVGRPIYAKGLRPRYDATGGLKMVALFAMETCFACSAGDGGGYYEATVELPILPVPEEFRPYRHVPPALVAPPQGPYATPWERAPDGVERIEGTDVQREHVRAAFPGVREHERPPDRSRTRGASR